MDRLLLDLAFGMFVLGLPVVALVIVLAMVLHLPADVVEAITVAMIGAPVTLGQAWLSKTRN